MFNSKWHWLWVFIIAYLIGAYFPGVAKMTVGKLIPSGGN